MIRVRSNCRCLAALAGVLVLIALLSPSVEAGGLLRKRSRVLVPTTQVVAPAPSPAPLGTFYPTPYIMVRGNYPAGGGYSPLSQFGDTTMSLYGPMSSLRSTSAPVLGYTRGYDGRLYVGEGTSFSTPNLPSLSPVVYPTQATYYYGFRHSVTPPWWKSGTTWIDQN